MPKVAAPPSFGASKPSMQTRFHIDLSWWESSNQDLRSQMKSICADLGVDLDDSTEDDSLFDWVNPETGQVSRVDSFYYSFLSQCACHEDYLSDRTSTVEALFRAIIGAGNQPMKPQELAEKTGRPASTILQTLSGKQVYKGMRPYNL